MTTTNYQQEAINALRKVGATMKFNLSNTKTADWDKDESRPRSHYKVTIRKDKKAYTFNFWGSINDFEKGIEPTEYDVIACLEYFTPESFEEFCGEYGYDTDSIKALKTHRACLRMSKALHRLFTEEELNILSEIR